MPLLCIHDHRSGIGRSTVAVTGNCWSGPRPWTRAEDRAWLVPVWFEILENQDWNRTGTGPMKNEIENDLKSQV